MNNIDNPFSVETPELMSAEEICELFVPIEEYYSLEVSGHVFLHGHRGSGKSMMFRRLSPDCQKIIHGREINELDFFGVYTSIKKTDIDIHDYSVIENSRTRAIIAEHVLVCFLAIKILRKIEEEFELIDESINLTLTNFFKKDFVELFEDLGFGDAIASKFSALNTSSELLNAAVKSIDKFYKYHISFLRRTLAGLGEQEAYEGPLFSFYDLLLPLIEMVMKIDFMPNGPMFLLIDDVDNLNLSQTKVLNTWVSYRTTDIVSFKLSTQMNYKSYLTLSGRRVESPHDFSEIHYSNVYTGSKKDKYPEWVREVTSRRLNSFYTKKYDKSFDIEPRNFFPADEKQERAIKEIAEKYKSGEIAGRGYRKNDDAYRYARPDYIASLGGSSKNTSTYKYAGFDQLVHLSSGVIRYFLEPANKMYTLQERHCKKTEFSYIEPTYQDKVVREEGDKFFFSHFEDLLNEAAQENESDCQQKLVEIEKLRNLIGAIGALFSAAIKSDKAERRFFSFALSNPDKISTELRAVLKLGVQEGYFYESYIGTKEGMGRTKLYVLTRRLAPCFNLDPIGFSAYKFLTCDFLEQCMNRPKSIVNLLKSKGYDEAKEVFEPRQQTLL